MRVRTSRRTGWPTASHMRRTWRLRPSWMTMRSTPGRHHAHPGRGREPVLELDPLAQAAQSAAGDRGRPPPRPGTPFRRRSEGGSGSWASSPSLVRTSSPSVAASRRPTGNTRGSAGTQVDHRRAALGVGGRGDHPGGLVEQVVDEARERPATGTPSTATRSAAGSTRRPSRRRSPLTLTRPPAMSSSQARRLPNPTRARTFWSRSPSAQRIQAPPGADA